MIRFLVVSHGQLAMGLKDSLSFFVEELDGVEALCLLGNDDPLEFGAKVRAWLLSYNDEVVVFADLPGGSPCTQVLLAVHGLPQVRVVAGVNLMMLIEGMIKRQFMTIGELVDDLVAIGRESVVSIELSDELTQQEVIF